MKRPTGRTIVLVWALASCAEASGPRQLRSTDLDIVVPRLSRTAPAAGQTVVLDAPNKNPVAAAVEGGGVDVPTIYGSMLQKYMSDVNVSATATMDFLADHASQVANLELWFGTEPLAHASTPGSFAATTFQHKQLVSDASILANTDCGITASANSEHHAWHQYMSNGVPGKQDEQIETHDWTGTQAGCATADTAVTQQQGGYAGDKDLDGSTWYICYWRVTYVNGVEDHRQLIACYQM
jgi:hypothetical protein